MKKRTIYQIMLTNTIIHKLYEDQINFEINVAYKLYKLKKEFDEIEELMFDRWRILFGDSYDIKEFNEDEILLYNSTLQVEIETDLYELTIDEIIKNNKTNLSISDIEHLVEFLES